MAHHGVLQEDQKRLHCLLQSATFASQPGIETDAVMTSATSMVDQSHFSWPDQEEALLREADFKHITLFYAGFSFRGWAAAACSN